MTRSDIQDQLWSIFNSRKDPEVAHGLEDQLNHDVLTAIAHGELEDITTEQAAELALTSMEIEFPRWVA
jgi:hypothetical protein